MVQEDLSKLARQLAMPATKKATTKKAGQIPAPTPTAAPPPADVNRKRSRGDEDSDCNNAKKLATDNQQNLTEARISKLIETLTDDSDTEVVTFAKKDLATLVRMAVSECLKKLRDTARAAGDDAESNDDH
jgi:hypothetical protein